MKKGIVAILFLAAVPFFVSAYTSPGKPTGYVNDFAGILSAQDKADLETTLSNFEKQTGDEITIVTVKSLGDETEQSYAVKLFEEWGIGQKGKDNGILILHAPNERRIRIEVGYGLEPYMTDAQSNSIYRNILTPAFQKGDYAGGYKEAVAAIIGTLNGQVDAIPQDTNSGISDKSFTGLLSLAFFAFIWIGSILARSKSWWLGGVFGAVAGVILGFIFGFFFIGIISIPVLIVLGLIFDYVVSKTYTSRKSMGLPVPWWIGGSGRGGSGGFGGGGGFGGFGGGGSGGGGGGGGY